MQTPIDISKTILLVILCLIVNLSSSFALAAPKGLIISTKSIKIVTSTCSKKDGSCEGYCTWSDGSTYEGEFVNGLPEGYGEQTWPTGSYYEGQFSKGYRHGNGTQLLDNGDQYIGRFTNGMMNGKGTYIWSNGTIYKGDYEDNQLQGYGHIQFVTGASYEGNWKSGKAHGDGIFNTAGGARFAGNYKKGKRYGKGMMTWNTGAILTGDWYNGFLVKEGLFKFQDGDGFWANWKQGVHDGKVKYNRASTRKFITVKWEALMEQLNAQEKANMAIVHYFIATEFHFNKNYEETIKHLETAKKLLDENDIRYDAINLELTIVKGLVK